MFMSWFDWAIVAAFFAVSLAVGAAVSRRAGASSAEYFAAGKSMPWWLLGVSMVATTFSTDTPNLVTNIVRQNGVAGNWAWWAFLLTGMLTVFVYARLWQRAGVLTDIEFYELRYSGKSAAFLRGFRAIYLGVFFNVLTMAMVSLAAIKIGHIILGVSPIQTLAVAGVITVIYSALGGLRGVLLTDCIQFIVAMIGSVGAAWFCLQHPEVGGLSGLLAHEAVQPKLAMVPLFDGSPESRNLVVTLLVIPLAVQWWSVWYPGAEPGGGGFIAQRMLAAKDERHAIGAAFFFNAAHYALRPWPWIIVALCSIVVFPDAASIADAFPHAAGVIAEDAAYPAMLTFLPAGFIGLVVASLIAAYMSTLSTLLNWGASYVVHDVYRRFLHPESSERHLVAVGRIATAVLMLLSGALALTLESALDSFNIMLQIGAGTGLLFILRWFWWRINAVSEIAAMAVSFAIALYFHFDNGVLFGHTLTTADELILGVGLTTLGWLAATFLTAPTDHAVLTAFYRRVHPGGPGWQALRNEAQRRGEPIAPEIGWYVPQALLCMLLGCIAIYGALFATGYWLYGKTTIAFTLTAASLTAAAALYRAWNRLAGTP